MPKLDLHCAATKPKEAKLQGGRFEEGITDAIERFTDAVEPFTESISFDKALYKHEIMGSKAHASMLPKQISGPEDWEKVLDPKKYFVQFSGTEEIREHHPLVEKAAHQQVSNEESGVYFLAIQSQELDISSSPTSCKHIQILSLPKHRDSSSKKPKKKGGVS